METNRKQFLIFHVIYQKVVLRVSSGHPDAEKQMKARGRRPSAFIVSRCLNTPVIHEARVFGIVSQTSGRLLSFIESCCFLLLIKQ